MDQPFPNEFAEELTALQNKHGVEIKPVIAPIYFVELNQHIMALVGALTELNRYIAEIPVQIIVQPKPAVPAIKAKRKSKTTDDSSHTP